MSRSTENTAFDCVNCAAAVVPHPLGSYRNHCNRCLFSLHVDGSTPGDRSSRCGGLMEPVGIVHTGRKGLMVVLRCRACGFVRRNRTAPDDDMDVVCMLIGRRVVG
ncbi:RNHCP domain-containing protein [Cellulomonas endometrii]|uniref:RNHCP domain-containing protein n=1 Tax=Cellulomonas endometrii TaxID=3036301 RepID=UPI003D15A9A0